MTILKDKSSFNFEEFKTQAIADMKAGKSLMGKEGVFTPLMKEFLEAALEGEIVNTPKIVPLLHIDFSSFSR